MSSYVAIVPLVCVWLGGVAAMLAEAFRSPGERMPIAGLGIIGLLTAGASAILLWNRGAASFGVVTADNFGLFVVLVLVLVGVLTLALSAQVVERDGINAGEYYAITLFALGGMMLMAIASDLLLIFLALEILSLGVYILTAIRRDSREGAEAAFKYFLLGGFSSAFFLTASPLPMASRERTKLESDCGRDVRPACRKRGADLSRRRAASGRLCVQGVGCAVSHVDARCVSGRASQS